MFRAKSICRSNVKLFLAFLCFFVLVFSTYSDAHLNNISFLTIPQDENEDLSYCHNLIREVEQYGCSPKISDVACTSRDYRIENNPFLDEIHLTCIPQIKALSNTFRAPPFRS